MLILLGAIIVTASVIGGFMLEGGQPQSLWHPAEIVIICGAAFGSLVVMAPGSVLLKLGKGLLAPGR